jgi:hypothetical protein
MNKPDFNPEKYLEVMSLLLELPINDQYKDGVIDNLETIKTIAKIVNEFPLPAEVEIAPVFEP